MSRDGGPLEDAGLARTLEAGALLPGGSIFSYEIGARSAARSGGTATDRLELRDSLAAFVGVRIAWFSDPWAGWLSPMFRGGMQVGLLAGSEGRLRVRRASIGPHLHAGLQAELSPGVDLHLSVGGDAWIAPLLVTWSATMSVSVQVW